MRATNSEKVQRLVDRVPPPQQLVSEHRTVGPIPSCEKSFGFPLSRAKGAAIVEEDRVVLANASHHSCAVKDEAQFVNCVSCKTTCSKSLQREERVFRRLPKELEL